MISARVVRKIRATLEEVWSLPKVKLTFVLVATALGTGTYYYPIVQTLFFPPPEVSQEQLAFYDKDNLYPIKVRKQREQEKEQTGLNSKQWEQEKEQAVLNSKKPQSS